MQSMAIIGAASCTALGLMVGYFTRSNKSPEPLKSDASRLIDWECDHEWSTCLEDKSPVDDFDCYVTDDDGSFPAEIFWRCERCQLKTNLQAVKVDSSIICHGNQAIVGKLSFNAFKNKLIANMNNP